MSAGSGGDVYELFEHTADLGLRVAAPDPNALFREAAEGFFSVIIEKIPRRGTPERLEFHLEADRLEFLFVDWLSELLYTFDTRRVLLDSFNVDVRGTTLTATALSQPFDEANDPLLHEVKAVTYHALRVAADPHRLAGRGNPGYLILSARRDRGLLGGACVVRTKFGPRPRKPD